MGSKTNGIEFYIKVFKSYYHLSAVKTGVFLLLLFNAYKMLPIESIARTQYATIYAYIEK